MRKTKRPWGTYQVINRGDGFKVKVVEVYPGAKLSLQKHNLRSEHWVVVQGKAKVIVGGQVMYVEPNQSTYIPKKWIHRLENPGRKPLKIVEVQCGKKLVEADIERFEDDFNRRCVGRK